MAMNSQPVSSRIRSAQRTVRDARLGQPMTLNQIQRLEKVLADCASDVEQLELVTGTAPVATQLKAAGSDLIAMRTVLRMQPQRNGGRRHG